MAWARDPVDVLDTARRKAARAMREAHNQCPLSAEQLRQVDKTVAEADRYARSPQTRKVRSA